MTVNWKITATTIFCDAIDDEATLIVFKDGTAKCAAYLKYGSPDRETARLLSEKGKRTARQLKCEGPECFRLKQYRDRLFTGSGT